MTTQTPAFSKEPSSCNHRYHCQRDVVGFST